MDRDLHGYLGVGKSALAAVQTAIGDQIPKSILDLPCGHGRVARHLRSAYPDADLFVSDLDEVGADFCAKEFKATKLVSVKGLADLKFQRTFDLIWVGSLITHLNQKETKEFLGFIERHLSADGIAIVTSHGAFVAGRLMQSESSLYGIEPPGEAKIFADYLRTGYGYSDYPLSPGYGISLTSREWIAQAASAAGLEVDSHRDHAWDNHQDVLALKLYKP